MSARVRLVLLSCLMLFLELALIRWLGSNVVYLSYFSNFVLLGSFLGIGIGFLRGRARVNLFPLAPVALALLVGLTLLLPVQIDRSGSDVIYFGSFVTTGLPAWLMLPVIFLAVAGIMGLVAEGVARTFVEFPPLEAYRLDIVGSILGIAAFSALSFTWASPVAWGAVVVLLFALLIRPDLRAVQYVALAAMLVMLGRESLLPGLSWSPYYKVASFSAQNDPNLTFVDVNGIPHQSMTTVADRRANDPVYFVPYQRLRATTALANVLIVGAGTGTDVAIALAQGAKHVDAVEIDPRLQQIGALGNPGHPYQDPRVSVIIDDGRAFLERTAKRYDLILFALPDSLTLVSGQSSLRLESYLFTVEAVRAARAHLEPNGTFAMYNYYREPWLIDRLGGTLQTVFGHPPCVDSVGTQGRLATLTVGVASGGVGCATTWQPTDAAAAATSATDDHPFLYLRSRAIPDFYLVTIGLILAASALLVRRVAGPLRPMRGYLDLFFMGAAFMLLETKSVVQFALLFGTTWFVNALVFAGVLVSVLAAVELTRRTRLPRTAVLYAALLAALLIAWLVPLELLLRLELAPRFVAASALAFAPIFLANLVFADRFRSVEASNLAFGANLLGAMAGGVLEYLALITGYQALLIVVGVLYALAFIGRGAITWRVFVRSPRRALTAE